MNETYALGPAARALKAEIDGETYVLPEYDTSNNTNRDPDELIESIRPRLYEVGAVIGSEICNSLYDWAMDTYPAYGLMAGEAMSKSKHNTKENSYSFMVESFFDTTRHFISGNTGYKLPKTHRDSYRELMSLVDQTWRADPDAYNYRSATEFIQGGINTGTLFSIAAHIGISSLYKASSDELSGKRFRQLAKNSYRLIMPPAMDNVGRLYAYKRALGADPYGSPKDKGKGGNTFAYNPNLLRFVPDLEDEDAYVDFKECPRDLIDPLKARKIGNISVNHPTLTCLGTVKFPGLEVASRLYWDWVSDVVTGVKY